MKLSQLAIEAGGKLVGGDAEIGALCTDSRVAGKGDLFFCIRGTREDSHAYAREAEKRGAAALVAERETDSSLPAVYVKDGREAMARIAAAFYGHPEREMKIVGVTGTNGKTTVTHMLHAVLSEAGKRAGLIGTLGARYGMTMVAPALTTPDPITLFSLLSDMKKAGTEIVAMEVSAHALALKKEIPIAYEMGVFTNLTQDHLDFFQDMEGYGAAKKSLFSRCRTAVLCADDPFSREIAPLCKRVVTYGVDSPSDCFAIVEREDLGGSKALLNLDDELCEAEIAMAGRHNVENALAAAVCGKRLGASMDDIARGLKKVRVEGRLEKVARYHGAEIFVDFAHTPDGLEKALVSLRTHAKGAVWTVFGCGGNRDRAKRPVMGETVARNCDFAVITSDNPRYEDPCAIIAEIEAGYKKVSRNYVAVEEREKAIAYALGKLKEGDVLLVAGKGGETQQEIMGVKYNYSDKTAILSLIGERHDG